MQLLEKMNKKMDQGYKITNYSCMHCKGVTMMKVSDEQQDKRNKQQMVYCPKCDKQYIPVKDQQQDDQNNEQDEYQQYYKQQKYNQPQKTTLNPQPSQAQKSKPNPNPATQPQPQPQSVDKAQQSYQQFLTLYNNITKNPQQQRSQQVSKKIGQKLIAGWTMLENACLECNVPLMRNKVGVQVCCGCDREFVNGKVKGKGKDDVSGEHIKKKDNIQKANPNTKIQQTQQIQHPPISKPPSQIPSNPLASPNPSCSFPSSSSTGLQQKFNQQFQTQCLKILTFLSDRLDNCINYNDFDGVQRVVRVLGEVKNLMRNKQ